MNDRIFLDSNMWIYIFAKDENEKSLKAKEFIIDTANKNTIVTSFQIINEVGNVLKRKKATETVIRQTIELLMRICLVQNFSKEILVTASEIRESHSFSYWDSIIIATAIFSGCRTIITEDMQDKRVIRNLQIINILS
jgi:predicted nucleic acid-binding protein